MSGEGRRKHNLTVWACILLSVSIVLASQGCLWDPISSLHRHLVPGEAPEWTQPGVRVGHGLFEKALFYSDGRLDTGTWVPPVTSICIGKWLPEVTDCQIAVVSGDRVVIVGYDGRVLDEVVYDDVWWSNKGIVGREEIFDADGDGTWEFYFGHRVGPVFLARRNGEIIWKKGVPHYFREWNIVSDAHGDLDGDGKQEFLLSGFDKMLLLDCHGEVIWKKRHESPLDHIGSHNVYFIDVLPGCPLEIVVVTGGHVFVLDADGHFVSEYRFDDSLYLHDSTLVQYPPSEGPIHFLGTAKVDGRRKPALIEPGSGKVVLPLDAPNIYDDSAVAVRFRADEAPYIALYGWGATQGRASVGFEYSVGILTIVNSEGTGVYCEHLAESGSTALATIPVDPNGEEALLVGGRGQVWKYQLTRDTSPNGIPTVSADPVDK